MSRRRGDAMGNKRYPWPTFPLVVPGQAMPCGCHTQQLEVRERGGPAIDGVTEVNVITGVALCNTLTPDGRAQVEYGKPGPNGSTEWLDVRRAEFVDARIAMESRIKRHTVHGVSLTCVHGTWGAGGLAKAVR